MTLCINPSCPSPHNIDAHLFCQGCGSELLLEGRYRVTKQRGKGGFGSTYEVRYRQAETKILKVLTDNLPKHVELFQREAFLLSQLHHPGIPAVEDGAYFTYYAKNRSEPLHCIIMEHVVGLDLQDYLRQRGQPIEQRLALQWLIQVVEILQVLHQKHVLHRDIKPSNIMLKAEGSLALVDFGTARSVTNISGDPSSQVGTRVVSSFYTPSEQMYGQAVAQSDFFALGRTFVYLVTATELGKLYDSTTDTLKWHQAAADLTPEFTDFLDYLMMPAVSQRPKTTAEILQQLQQLQTSSSSIPTIPLADAPAAFTEEKVDEEAASPPSQEIQAPRELDEQFVGRCQKELAEFIGPIAAIVCQQELATHSTASERDFIEVLSRHINKHQDADEFKRKIG
ncbi:MAG: serine/threonine-protein kinase [Cyanobacteria bacterium P01_A01_bin.17]